MLHTLSDYFKLARTLLACTILLIATHSQAATILVLGDSLSAGYGLKEPTQGWVSLLESSLPQHQVINASISGDTLASGKTRLPKLISTYDPDVVIIELGGNDGLRGFSLASIRQHLQSLIQTAKASGAQVLLLEIQIPPNYGKRYTDRFTAIYGELAQQEDIDLMPFFLAELALLDEMMQPDGIHPTALAQPHMRDQVIKALTPLLARLANN